MELLGKPIYLDYNATTPTDPAVVKAMVPFFKEQFGNPSSSHQYGRISKDAVDKARNEVANLISAAPEEIVFTSGGSESDNAAILGVALASMGTNGENNNRRHIITSRVEHPAVLESCGYLEERLPQSS